MYFKLFDLLICDEDLCNLSVLLHLRAGEQSNVRSAFRSSEERSNEHDEQVDFASKDQRPPWPESEASFSLYILVLNLA